MYLISILWLVVSSFLLAKKEEHSLTQLQIDNVDMSSFLKPIDEDTAQSFLFTFAHPELKITFTPPQRMEEIEFRFSKTADTPFTSNSPKGFNARDLHTEDDVWDAPLLLTNYSPLTSMESTASSEQRSERKSSRNSHGPWGFGRSEEEEDEEAEVEVQVENHGKPMKTMMLNLTHVFASKHRHYLFFRTKYQRSFNKYFIFQFSADPFMMNTNPLSEVPSPFNAVLNNLHINAEEIDISRKIGDYFPIRLNPKAPEQLRIDFDSKSLVEDLTCEGFITRQASMTLNEAMDSKLDYFDSTYSTSFPRYMLFQSKLWEPLLRKTQIKHHTMFVNLTQIHEVLNGQLLIMHFTCDSKTIALSLSFPFRFEGFLDFIGYPDKPIALVSNFTEQDGTTTLMLEKRVALKKEEPPVTIVKDVNRTIWTPALFPFPDDRRIHTLAKGKSSLVTSFNIFNQVYSLKYGQHGKLTNRPPPQLEWDPEHQPELHYGVSSNYSLPYVFHLRVLLLPADNHKYQTVELLNQEHRSITKWIHIKEGKQKKLGPFHYQGILKREMFENKIKSWPYLKGRKLELQFSVSFNGTFTPFRIYIVPGSVNSLPPRVVDPQLSEVFKSIKFMDEKLNIHQISPSCEHSPIVDVPFDAYSTFDFEFKKKNPTQKSEVSIYAVGIMDLLQYTEKHLDQLPSTIKVSSKVCSDIWKTVFNLNFQAQLELSIMIRSTNDRKNLRLGCFRVRLLTPPSLVEVLKSKLDPSRLYGSQLGFQGPAFIQFYEHDIHTIFKDICKQVSFLANQPDFLKDLKNMNNHRMSFSIELHHQFNKELSFFIDEWKKLPDLNSPTLSPSDKAYFQNKARDWLVIWKHSTLKSAKAMKIQDYSMVHLQQLCKLATNHALFFSNYINTLQPKRYSYLFPQKIYSQKDEMLEKLLSNVMSLCDLEGRLYRAEYEPCKPMYYQFFVSSEFDIRKRIKS